MSVSTSTLAQPAEAVQQPAAGKTSQIVKKAYNDLGKIVCGVNNQIRNYNITTALKITLIAMAFFASTMLIVFSTFSLFGLSFSLAAFSWQIASASILSVGITVLFSIIVRKATIKRLSENQNKFLDKISKDFQKIKYGNYPSIFKIAVGFSRIDGNFELLKATFYSVKKIQLNSYEETQMVYKANQIHLRVKRELRKSKEERKRFSKQQNQIIHERRSISSFINGVMVSGIGYISIIAGVIFLKSRGF